MWPEIVKLYRLALDQPAHSKVDASNVLLRSVGGLIDRMQIDDMSRLSERALWTELLHYLRQIPGVPAAAVDVIEVHLDLPGDDGAADGSESVGSKAQMPALGRVA
jgi:hypothetical protein